MSFIKRWLVLASLLGLAACAGIAQRMEPLNVSVADLSLIDAGLIEQRFGVILRVRNPNGFDIPIQGLSYTLEVNEQPFAQGLASSSARIPRYGEAIIETEAVSNLSRIMQQLQALQKDGQLRYHLQGKVDVGGFRGVEPFSMDGEIALPDFAK